jgi:hypothetical protein
VSAFGLAGRYVTDRPIVDVVRELARAQSDQHIARVLNRLGYRTGADHTRTQSRVASLRSHRHIPAFDRNVDRPCRYSGALQRERRPSPFLGVYDFDDIDDPGAS